MTATTYILTGDASEATHIDLGLQVGNLSLVGRSFEIKGSAGDNSFFLRPAGYSFDFTDTALGDGADKVYLTRTRAEYAVVVDAASGDVTLTRGTGADAENITIARLSNMRVVFADGYVTADALTAAAGETLTTSETSLAPNLPATNSGGVRVGASGGIVDQTSVFGLSGPAFAAFGNGGVDQVFVAAGASVEALDLGAGTDEIYLEGSWSDYTKQASGSNLILTRQVANALTGGIAQESITVVGGVGANNDRLLFDDGSVSTRDALLAVRGDSTVDITTNTAIWDAGNTSFSSAADIQGANNLTLTADTGTASDDGLTSNGSVTVSGVAEGYVWQYSVDGGQNWQSGTGSTFTLAAQASGETGVTYAAGQVQVRQVNPFGVASSAVANTDDIIIDNATSDPAFSPPVRGLLVEDTSSNRVAVEDVTFVATTGLTFQFWFYVDDIAQSGSRQLLGTNFSAQIDSNSNGRIEYFDRGDRRYEPTELFAANGWNFISISTVGDSDAAISIINSKSPDGKTDTVTTNGTRTDDDYTITFGARTSGDNPLDAVIRDLAIWNGARDLSTVVSDSKTPPTASSTGILNYWPLDDAMGTPATALTELISDGPEMTYTGSPVTGQPVSAYFPGAAGQTTASLPTIFGQDTEPFAKVTISYDGGSGPVTAGTTTADSQGRWSFLFPASSPLPDGNYTITAEAEDEAGNTVSTNTTITVDGAIPLAPDLDAASDTGASNTDNITNDVTPTVSGSLPASVVSGTTTVEVYVNGEQKASGVETGTTGGLTLDYGALTWSYTPESDQPPGEYSLTVVVGGVSSAPLLFTVDDSATPAAVDTPFDTALVTNNTADTDGGGARLDHDFAQNATVAAWVYIADPKGETTQADQFIYHTFRDLGLEIQQGTGELDAYIGGSWVDTGLFAEEGWHYIAITDAPDRTVVYYNDQEFEYGQNSDSRTGEYLNLGRHEDGDRRAFMGAFRDVQVWDRTLSGEEIEAARDGAVDLADPALVGYWAMDPSSVYEDSGTSHIKNAVTGGLDLALHDTALIEVTDQKIIESASFNGDNLVVSGVLAPDITALTVSLSDNDAGTTNDPSVAAVIDARNGTWTATFTRAQMAAMTDGVKLAFTLDAVDAAGNTSSTTIADAVELEIDNQDPQSNAAQAIAPIPLAFGTLAGVELLDLTDLNDDDGTTTDDTAFTDGDTPGSANATLTYSATLQNGDPLPDWLEMTPEGVLRIASGESAPDINGALTLTVTAADGGGGVEASRDIELQMPKQPDLEAASDSGASNTDNITNQTQPTLQGDLPSGTAANTRVAIYLNGAEADSRTTSGGTPGVGLEVDYSLGSWRYTQQTPLVEGDNVFTLYVDGVPSPDLTVTVDTSIADPALTNPPAVVQDSSFVSDALTLNGALEGDIASLTVSLDDGDPGSANDPTVAANIIDNGDGTWAWTATFTRAQMAAMTDGAALSYTLNATDNAGNSTQPVTSGATFLELVNQTPEENSAQAMPALVAGIGSTGLGEGTVLLDVTDLNGDSVLDDAAFIDNDAPGSVHASLTYSATMDDDTALPGWLEMTPAGLLRVVANETVPDFGASITVKVIATDGANATVTRDVTINAALTLTSVMNGATEVDVRSDLVLESITGSDNIGVTDADGVYEIRLVQRADSGGKTGFDGEVTDGSQTITVTISGGSVASVVGGSLDIVDGKAKINFDEDLDLSRNFGVEADQGLFVSTLSSLASDAVVAGQVAFSTVTPSAAGTVAKIWDDATSTFVDGDSWYDGTDGDYFGNDVGLSVDLGAVTGVVALGHDGADTSNIVLNAYGRTVLTGFGGDDLLYVDRGVGHVANDLSINEIGVRDEGGNVPTILTFTGASFQAGVLITFADDPATTGADESDLVAVAFNAADAGPGEHSFESITGNAAPVIGG